MIDITHAIPIYGHWRAYNDTMEAYDQGDISAFMAGSYLGSLYAATTLHQIHMAEKTGRVSLFAINAVKRIRSSPAAALMTAPITLAALNMEQIKSAPEEQQRSLWRSFSQGLTGGFGTGTWEY